MFFKWCVQEGLIEQDPMERMTPPKVRRKVARYLTVEEAGTLVRSIESDAVLRSGEEREEDPMWLADLVRVQLGTGMRIGEAASLRWSAVRLGRQPTIVVGKHELTKSGHQRTMPITGEALGVIRRLGERRTSEADDLVLAGAGGGRVNEAYASKRIELYAESVGLGGDVTSHTLRHTYGAILASSGVSPYIIKELMGHESVDTTLKFYGHLYPDRLHAAIEGVFGAETSRVA